MGRLNVLNNGWCLNLVHDWTGQGYFNTIKPMGRLNVLNKGWCLNLVHDWAGQGYFNMIKLNL